MSVGAVWVGIQSEEEVCWAGMVSGSAVGFSTVVSPYPSPMPSAFDSSDTTTPAPGKDNEPFTDYVIRSKDYSLISHNEEYQCEKDEEDGEEKKRK